MIAVLGATGYTGRLVAAELRRRQVAARLGGRDPERLAQVPRDDNAETFVVDVTDERRLDEFLDGASALITTVGPFARLGRPVVDAAVRAGVPYVDSTGEPAFMRDVYQRHAGAPTTVVPACGFDYVPGDLAAALAAEAYDGQPDEIRVHYDIRGMVPSRGTARSAIGAVAASDPVVPRRHRVAFPAGTRTTVELPWGERLTIPRHHPGPGVVTAVVVPAPMAAAASLTLPAARRLAPLIQPALDRLVDRLPEGPGDDRRRRTRFEIVAEALGPAGRSFVHCQGADVYGLTARFLVEAATILAGSDRPPGARAPAEVLDPARFLDAVTGDDEHGSFSWTPAFPVPPLT